MAAWRVFTRQRYIPLEAPASLPQLVGRDDEIAEVVKFLAVPSEVVRIAVISGAPGTGKSALALAAAQRLSHFFRDGQIYLTQGAAPRPQPAGQRRLLII